MLGLPKATEVNGRVSKDKIYTNASPTPQVREIIKDQIEAIFWRNKLADSIIGIAKGEKIEELQVFEIRLRQAGLDKRAITTIAKVIPYKILFVLTHGEQAQAWMNVEGTFYNTNWLPADNLGLKFEGLNLDAVYENLARQIADGQLAQSGDIGQAVENAKRRQKLEKDIAALEKKLLREKQFNKQVELNGELKRLRKELEGLG